MTGNNELLINEATMIEAVQYWLNAQFVKEPPVIQSISGGGGQYDRTFTIKVTSGETPA